MNIEEYVSVSQLIRQTAPLNHHARLWERGGAGLGTDILLGFANNSHQAEMVGIDQPQISMVNIVRC